MQKRAVIDRPSALMCRILYEAFRAFGFRECALFIGSMHVKISKIFFYDRGRARRSKCGLLQTKAQFRLKSLMDVHVSKIMVLIYDNLLIWKRAFIDQYLRNASVIIMALSLTWNKKTREYY